MMRLLFTSVCLLVWLTAELQAQAVAGIGFDGPVTIANVPRPPVTVHAGDFNNDGKLDLVSSNGTRVIYVIFQDPQNRARWIPAPINVGASCYFSRAGDFDGDGIDDLAVSDGASTAFFVRSKGDGTFDKPQGIPQARGSRWIALGDWNGDGRLDMASSNLNTSTLTIFVNEPGAEGAVVFRQTQNPASGREHTLEPFDYDGDGILDLSLGTGLPGIQLHKGVGDGKFQYKPPNVSNLGCVEYIAVGDFNEDGKGDIAPTCIDDGVAYVGISVGDGRFTRALAAPFAAGTEATAVADLNGDNHDDLAVTSAGSGSLRVYPGTGDGKFLAHVEFGPTGAGPLFVIAADLDRDGHNDVISADTGGTTLTIFYGREGERFLQSADSITGYPASRGFGIGDFDRDGTPDVFVTATSLAKAYIYLKPGGTAPTKPTHTIDLADNFSTLALADLNQDSIPDLVGSNLTDDSILIALLNAEAKAVGELRLPAGDAPQDVEVGFIDAGPHVDLAAPAQSSNQISLYLGKGDGTFSDLIVVPTIERPRRVRLGDFNGDSRTDLVVVHAKVVALHLQGENGTFAEPLLVLNDTTKNITESTVGDIDSDGKDDIVLTESRSLGALILPGRGDGTFGAILPVKLDAPPSSVLLTDFDGDGQLDITAASSTTQLLAISLNLGPVGFSPATLIRMGTGGTAHRVQDMNNDEVPDIIGFGANSTTIRLGRREGPPPEPLLRRGDADGNLKVQINDAVSTLNGLFREGFVINCEDAADFDDNGKVDLTDAVNTLNWLFREGPEPSAPGPINCGRDPNPDELPRCVSRC